MGTRRWTVGALTAVTASIGLLVGLRSIVRLELPTFRPLIGIEALPREGLGIAWTSRAVWPADIQAAGLERLAFVIAALVLSAALLATLNALILLAESAASRRTELALRSAIGAAPSVAASALAYELRGLLVIGLVLGTLAGLTGGGLLRLLWPGPLGAIRVDAFGDVLVGLSGTVALLVATHVLTGLRATRGPGVAAALRTGSRAGSAPAEVFVRNALAAAHVAVAGALLVGTLALSIALDGDEPSAGRGPTSTVLAVTAPGPTSWGPILARIGEIPGIEAGSLATPGALVGLGIREIATAECGRCFHGTMPAPLKTALADHHAVAPAFFDLAGIEVVEGRDFAPSDGPEAERVAIVNQTYARSSFELGRPIGKKIRIGSDFANWYTVIGVVSDTPVPVLGADPTARESVYLSALQQSPGSGTILLRGDDRALEAARQTLVQAGLSPGPPSSLGAHRAHIARPLKWTQRLAAAITLLALFLATQGIYATALQTTRRRVGELAVRRALGARDAGLARHVLVGRLRVVGWGLVGFAFFGTMMVALLQNTMGLTAAPPVAYAAIALVLVAAALAASIRATRAALAVQPAAALERG